MRIRDGGIVIFISAFALHRCGIRLAWSSRPLNRQNLSRTATGRTPGPNKRAQRTLVQSMSICSPLTTRSNSGTTILFLNHELFLFVLSVPPYHRFPEEFSSKMGGCEATPDNYSFSNEFLKHIIVGGGGATPSESNVPAAQNMA